jgi:hypothetical protein
MKKFSTLVVLFFFVICSALGQNTQGFCGTTIEDQAQYTARLQANIAKAESGDFVRERGAIQYVPIHFHLVGSSAGEGKHKERLVLDQLCALNAAYAPMDIRFYLKPHPTYGLFDKSINNNNVYENQSNAFLMQTRRHQSALNVYVVNSAGPPGVLAYYNPPYDWIVANKDDVNSSSLKAVPHEVGHFFSLRHTFYGYEDFPFDGVDDPSWPIAPVIGPAAPTWDAPTERVDGSNCSTAADLICDTPPDYNFGSTDPEQNCVYNNYGAKDPLGVPVTDPMENNFMSYFFNCSTNVFTSMQQDAILADLASPERNYLVNTFSPASTEINTPTDLLINPPASDTTEYYDEVLLEWKSVAGATYYLLEMDWLSTYTTSNYRSYVLSDTTKFLTDLPSNRLYYWRVRPFNEYITCAQHRQRSFRTSITSATNEIEALSAWQIAPNPASNNAPVRLFVNAVNNFEASVRIFDATGRQVRSLNSTTFSAGETTLELPTEGLSGGLYFIAIENAEGRAVRKMTIVR